MMENQEDRPIGSSPVPRWIGASALAGAAALHALPLAALLVMGTPPAGALEQAAITVFVEPGGAPVATASEVAPATRSVAAETATATDAPAERPLDDAVPPPEPIDAHAVPDFRPAVPPPPELRDALPAPDVAEAEAPDFSKQMPDLRDALPPPEPREAAVPDFRPPPAPVPSTQEPRPEPPRPAPPPQQAEPEPPPQKAQPKPPPPESAPPKPPPQKAQPKPPPPQNAQPKPAPQQEAKPRSAPPAPRAAAPAPAPSPAPSAAPSPRGGSAGAAPPAAASQPGSASAVTPVAPGWNALLAAWLAANRRYPEEARRRGVEGEVTVRFSVAADGRVTDVAIVAASGSSALDGAAVAMLRGARLPAPGADVTRTVRIRYRLAD
jgi:protein TonB